MPPKGKGGARGRCAKRFGVRQLAAALAGCLKKIRIVMVSETEHLCRGLKAKGADPFVLLRGRLFATHSDDTPASYLQQPLKGWTGEDTV